MSGHRILIVEDTALVRRTLCDFLRQLGYEVAESASAADAVPMQQAFGPDCIVADYSLGDGDASTVRTPPPTSIGMLSAAARRAIASPLTGIPLTAPSRSTTCR